MIVDGKNVARVFPRRTKATPDDAFAFTSSPTLDILAAGGIDEVHVSVSFTYDREKAEQLAEEWTILGVPVSIGGPAYGKPSGEFTPGLYLKPGYTITSRGCPNSCWFCQVWKREPQFHELEIKDGWNILDDNVLASSQQHFSSVIEMLKRQPHPPIFTGGLEAKILTSWHAELLKSVKPQRLYFAYDTPDDYEPLVNAGRILRKAGFTTASHVLGCYVLIGYNGDTFEKAEQRLYNTIKAGFSPYAMLYRNEKGETDAEWRRFQREWCRPQLVGLKFREIWGGGAHRE